MGKAGLPEMYLVIDEPRQEVVPFQVDHPGRVMGEVLPYLFNPIPFDQQVAFLNGTFIDKTGIF